MKIGVKFLLIIVLITVLLGITALSGVLFATSHLEQQINDKYMAVAAYAMEKVQRHFSRGYENMRMLANEPILRSRGSSPAAITRLLLAYKKHHQRSSAPYSAISFFALNRTRIADTGGEELGVPQPSPEFWAKIAAGADYVLDISSSPEPNRDFFHLARVVRDQRDVPFGVVVASIPVDALQTVLTRPLVLFNLRVKPDVDLLDRHGLILYSNHNRAAMLHQVWPTFDSINRALANGKHTGARVFTGPQPEKTKQIQIFAREEYDSSYHGNDWTLVIAVPQNLALFPMLGLRNRLILIILGIGCFSAAIAILLSRTITRPLVQLSEAATEVGTGNWDIAVEVASTDEVGRLAKTFNSMVKKLEELNRALQRAASTDKLTGAMNRSRIDEVLFQEMTRAKRYRNPLSMILMDLDHFKQVNDNHGHLVGDEVLKTVVAVIQQNIRAADALGRWGGEEFLLLLPETDLTGALEVAEKVCRSIANCALNQVGRVTISCGVAQMRATDSADDLIKRADDALYEAKHRGRNQVAVEQAA